MKLIPVLLLALTTSSAAQGPTPTVFSGPQVGEPLPPCPVLRIPGDASREHDFSKPLGDTPLFLVFVHKRTRPALGLVQLLTRWAADRPKDEADAEPLSTRVVWLDDDRSAARAYLTSDRTKLELAVPLGISIDGGEGPGAYGLNREVVLTLLLAREGVVLSNFALTAPSDTDAPAILAAVAASIGEEPPSTEDIVKYRERYETDPMSAIAEADPTLRREVARMRPTRLTAAEVGEIAQAVERLVADNGKLQHDLGLIATAATARKDFEKLGTEAAREQLRAWAAKYGSKPTPRR